MSYRPAGTFEVNDVPGTICACSVTGEGNGVRNSDWISNWMSQPCECVQKSECGCGAKKAMPYCDACSQGDSCESGHWWQSGDQFSFAAGSGLTLTREPLEWWNGPSLLTPPDSSALSLAIPGSGASTSGAAGKAGKSNANFNFTIKRVNKCLYELTFIMWVNTKASKKFKCSTKDIKAGKKQVEEALKKFWNGVECPCKPGAKTRANKKKKSCKFTVKVKWVSKGKPTVNSGSMTKEEEAAWKLRGVETRKKGDSAEVYFKCTPAPKAAGVHIGEGRPGNPKWKGFFWVYAGSKNAKRPDLISATAHEIGHNITKGPKANSPSPHSKNKKDIMFPTTTKGGQSITKETACRVAEFFASDKMCEECCPDGFDGAFAVPPSPPKVEKEIEFLRFDRIEAADSIWTEIGRKSLR